jgi:hypothetical protein
MKVQNFSCFLYWTGCCALMLEAADISETSVKFYQTKRRYNPEDSHLHTRRRENLTSHNAFYYYSKM